MIVSPAGPAANALRTQAIIERILIALDHFYSKLLFRCASIEQSFVGRGHAPADAVLAFELAKQRTNMELLLKSQRSIP